MAAPILRICLAFCLVLSSDAILNPVDFLALQSIRKSLKDLPGSNFFASWDFTSDPCGFAGVYCESDRVVSLNLGDPRAGAPGLGGRLSPAIGKLAGLVEFSVVPGKIMGSIPISISGLTRLRFLAISRNYVSGVIPAGIGRLRGLRTLDFSYNQLAGEIPGSVGELPEIVNLVLCHNHFSGEVPRIRSRSLTRLDLKHNRLTGSVGLSSIPASVRYLSLSFNQLDGPVDRVLNRLNRLTYLDLSFNRFTGTVPGRVFTYPITNLQLQRNLFSGPVSPTGRVSIQTVDLSYNRLSGPISPLFSTVQNLFLNNNRFTGHVPAGFVDRLLSANIQTLYLQHNFLTGMGIDPTADIPSSSSLCVQYNCMVPPVQSPCPLRTGKQKTRPTSQCIEWRG